ncbi:MAG: LysR family transcriptional regulator [Rhodobiaceae bacterium]|nr:putative HTH-type transcriptional regulator YahB [Rhodobiaceae bacterium]MCR9242928.1 LysR family transcriptional regulator [Rhodobiaceae bacterium]
MHPNLLDQLTVFETIADVGTFSAAAKQLNRTVSAVGYTIGQLEEHLGLKLFDRSGYRPQLTEEGKAILRDANMIARRIERLSARADALKKNTVVNATILIDSVFPRDPLAEALALFSRKHPEIQLTIHETQVDKIAERLEAGEANIGLLALNDMLPMRHFDGRQIALRGAFAVVAPDHPLAHIEAPFSLSEFDNHRQIILSSEAVDEGRYNYHVHVTDLWAVNTASLALDLVRQGVGWCFMTRDSVAEDLETGRLVALECADIHDWAAMRFTAFWKTNQPPDAPLTYLIDMIEKACEESPGATRLIVG